MPASPFQGEAPERAKRSEGDEGGFWCYADAKSSSSPFALLTDLPLRLKGKERLPNYLKRCAIASILLTLAGCGKEHEFALGTQWNYTVRWGTDSSLSTDVKVTRRITVAGAPGFETMSPNGTARLAIKDDLLMADSISGARFEPALPILALGKKFKDGDEDQEVTSYDVTMHFLKTSQTCHATLQQRKYVDSFNNNKVTTQVATLTLSTPRKKIQLRTEFLPGIGIINQEQRSDNNFDFGLELLKYE